jgi:uncharacterized protein (TIGR02677 family)
MHKRFGEIVETKYLNTENTERYRTIIHFMYSEYQRFNNQIYPETIFRYLREDPFLMEVNYTIDLLHQDLNQLVRWGNLAEQQDAGRCRTPEEFKNRRYRYQCTRRTIEIERMIELIERLNLGFRGTLEKSHWLVLYETIQDLIQKIEEPRDVLSGEEIHHKWGQLFRYFRELTNNAQDYLAHLQSQKVQEMMMTESFLIFKDKLIDHLRNFVTASHIISGQIQAFLRQFSNEMEEKMFIRLMEYEMSSQHFGTTLSHAQIEEEFRIQWMNLKSWFLGQSNIKSEWYRLQQETTEAIRRVTKNAQRLSETRNNLQSRWNEYIILSRWFDQLSIEEANRLSALVFGVFQPQHLCVTSEKATDDIYANIWMEEPSVVNMHSQNKGSRERSKPAGFHDRVKEKEEQKRRYILERQQEEKMIEQLIQNDEITLNNLPLVNPFVRRTILRWIDRCQGDKNKKGRTESGYRIQMLLLDTRRIKMECEDGCLDLPNYTFRFEKEDDSHESHQTTG